MRGIGRAVAAAAGVGALLLASAAPASAISLLFSEATGFRATTDGAYTPTLQALPESDGTVNPAIAGDGGLEFKGLVTVGPGPIPPGGGAAPPDVYTQVLWGCQPSASGIKPYTNCANGGVVGVSTSIPAPTPFTPGPIPDRSGLELTGLSGTLTDAAWATISEIKHQNAVISGNNLQTVRIDSRFYLGKDPEGTPPIFDPSFIPVGFTESRNGTCGSTPGVPGAPSNPLGSSCDDFFTLQKSALNSVTISDPALLAALGLLNPTTINFRLLVPGDADPGCFGGSVLPTDTVCVYDADPSTLVVYSKEGTTNTLQVQAILVDVPEPTTILLFGTTAVGMLAEAVRRRRQNRSA